MRIGLVAPPWLPVPPAGYGGTERAVALLADGLVARGHDVTLFGAVGSRTAARLVTPLATPPPFINASHEDEAFHSLAALRDADEFDVVHDHTRLGPVLAATQAEGTPVVHTLHGRWTPGTRRIIGAIAERVHLVAISHAQRRENVAIPYAGVVHNGVDLQMHPLRAEKEDFCVFIGRINPEKGPDAAIEIARAARLPLVMIVKREEPGEWQYWDEVVAPLLHSDVTVLEQPPHTVKVDLLGRARVALCPIDWPEPFGLVYIEAAACGTPVVTRPLGAAPEIVVDGITGFLCATTDAMVNAIDAAGDLSPHSCRAHAMQHFSADAMVAGYERIYRAAYAAQPPARWSPPSPAPRSSPSRSSPAPRSSPSPLSSSVSSTSSDATTGSDATSRPTAAPTAGSSSPS